MGWNTKKNWTCTTTSITHQLLIIITGMCACMYYLHEQVFLHLIVIYFSYVVYIYYIHTIVYILSPTFKKSETTAKRCQVQGTSCRRSPRYKPKRGRSGRLLSNCVGRCEAVVWVSESLLCLQTNNAAEQPIGVSDGISATTADMLRLISWYIHIYAAPRYAETLKV